MKKKNRLPVKSILLGILAVGIVMVLGGMSPSDTEIRSKVMKLVSARGSCSGEQVHAPSGVDYVLTAAHCRILEENGSIRVIAEDGRKLDRRILAEDPESDLLILEGMPGIRGLDISPTLSRFETIRTFTHGRGKDTYKTEGAVIQQEMMTIPAGDVQADGTCGPMPKYLLVPEAVLFGFPPCMIHVIETAMTAMIAPGSSGGPVVNSSGELVGVVSAGDGTFGYLVTLVDIQRFLHDF